MRAFFQVRSLAFLAAASTLAGCHSEALPVEPAPPVARPESSGLTLEEIADRIDPGAQEPLSDGLPPWMFEVIGLDANPTASGATLLDRAASEQAAFDAQMKAGLSDHTSMVFVAQAAARALVLAEQAMDRGGPEADGLAQLERAYAAVDVPMLASDRSTFGQVLLLFAEAAAAGGVGPSNNAQLQQLAGVVQGAMRAAGPLHRRTVAKLLRTAPDHEAVPTALLAVAQAHRGKDADWTIRAAKLAIELRGRGGTPQDQLDLARVCFVGLDVACGDEALRAAAGAKGSDDVAQDAVLARRIVELQGASTLESRLERAHAMLKLGRHESAKSEFEALRSEAPNDARPVGGLALHAIETEFDFGGANRIIDAQEGLTNGDALYYQLAIGTRAMAAMATILPSVAGDADDISRALEPLIRRMRADIDGYAALGNSDAEFLGLILDVGVELLDQYEKAGTVSLRNIALLSDRAVTLHSRIPGNPHAYRLLMSAALFEVDRSRAAEMVGVAAPNGPQRDALVLRRARALADLAVTWSDADFANLALEALREVDPSFSSEAAELHADAMMIQRILGSSSPWETIGEAYEVLLDDNMTPEDARAVNNVAVAVFNNDGLPVAQQAWSLSSQLSEDHGDVARLNLLVSTAPGGNPSATEAMRTLASETKVAGVRVTALAWVLAWSQGKAARRDAAAALKTAVEEAQNEGARPTAPDPYSGLILEGSFNAGLGYAVKTGLQIDLDGSGLPWAILAPPRP